ncbi:hypothetical protein [Limosilactobacillus caecicola]|uniref:hypothetical protein n=1 Tax=Limosilactobacillus caecicola TaxID=2941332 RepID=UPI0020408D03|nr:hypothetical protein [Limosilactobacillus caecicola]
MIDALTEFCATILKYLLDIPFWIIIGVLVGSGVAWLIQKINDHYNIDVLYDFSHQHELLRDSKQIDVRLQTAQELERIAHQRLEKAEKMEKSNQERMDDVAMAWDELNENAELYDSMSADISFQDQKHALDEAISVIQKAQLTSVKALKQFIPSYTLIGNYTLNNRIREVLIKVLNNKYDQALVVQIYDNLMEHKYSPLLVAYCLIVLFGRE